MAGAVSRLRLRAPAGSVVTARARIEDALRLADTDDRLLLLQRVDLGRMPLRAHPVHWAARTAERVNDLRNRAVHAAMPGALFADSVWFRSLEEARALLLRELAAGRVPSAWFWRLAVRDWGGLTLAAWLPRLAAETVHDPRRLVALAHAVLAIAAAGHLPAVAAALAGAALPPAPIAMPPRTPAAAPPGTEAREAEGQVLPRVDRLLARHDPATRHALLAAIVSAPAGDSKAAWIARFALVAAAPELASHPTVLARAASVLIERASAPPGSAVLAEPWADPGQPDPFGRSARNDKAASGAANPYSVASPEAAPPAVVPAPAQSTPTPEVASAPELRTPEPAYLPATGTELVSAGAGVFLLARALVLMGLPAWLDRRPALAADGFGRGLLHAVAARMRVGADDPLFAVLGAEPNPAWQGELDAWRIGLDRWLRRTARVRLAAVVRRRGWITATGETLTIRFRADTADVRLRRRALDIDPGWVPWLGLVMRYHYRDDPVSA